MLCRVGYQPASPAPPGARVQSRQKHRLVLGGSGGGLVALVLLDSVLSALAPSNPPGVAC